MKQKYTEWATEFSLIGCFPCKGRWDSHHGSGMNAEWLRSLGSAYTTFPSCRPPARAPDFLGGVQKIFGRVSVFRHSLEACQWPPCHRWWDLLQLCRDTVLGVIPGGRLLSRRFPNNTPRAVFIHCFLCAFKFSLQISYPG